MKNPAKAAGERLPRPDLAERVVFLTGGIVSEDLFQFLTDSGRPFIASRSISSWSYRVSTDNGAVGLSQLSVYE